MLPINPARIKAIYAEALKLQKAGRLAEAEQRHRAILSVRPKTAESLYQLGWIALARKAPTEALTHLARARAVSPAEPAIWRQMARAHAALGRGGEIARFREEARRAPLPPSEVTALDRHLGRDPDLPGPRDLPADLAPLAAHLNAGRPAEAARLAWAVLAAGPSEPAPVLHALAAAQRALGRHAAADAAFAEAEKKAPDGVQIRIDHARLLLETGQLARIPGILGPMLEAADPPPEALALQAEALEALGQRSRAADLLQQALDGRPESDEMRFQLAGCLRNLNRNDEALEAAEAGLVLNPESGPMHLARALALTALGRNAEARAAFDAAVTRMPREPRALGERAIFLQALGEFEAAEADFRAALALDPANGTTYRTFLTTHRVGPDDPLLAQMEQAFAAEEGDTKNRAELAFALARAMEQTDQHDRIFTYLHPANAIIHRRTPYDIRTRRAELDEVRRIFEDCDVAARQVAGATDAAPVFITGMPRSGSTLIEQILASHSQVEGAGETGIVRTEFHSVTDGADGPRRIADITDGELAVFGHRVAERQAAFCPGAARVADKSIMTYMVMGAVRMAMPNARIVLVRRDPCDVALSIYKNLFAEGLHRYAYDLRTLGLYYAMFEEMVDFWRERMPGGFVEVEYESLIDDPEGQTRRLLAACDLAWEDRCLSFHETKRRVSTLSVGQVRRPIYRSSVKAWHRHEADLAPFIEALEEGRRMRRAA